MGSHDDWFDAVTKAATQRMMERTEQTLIRAHERSVQYVNSQQAGACMKDFSGLKVGDVLKRNPTPWDPAEFTGVVESVEASAIKIRVTEMIHQSYAADCSVGAIWTTDASYADLYVKVVDLGSFGLSPYLVNPYGNPAEPEPSTHVAGIDKEEIDMDAFNDFMRSL